MAEHEDRAELSGLETALRELTPRCELDREALMFAAGRASARARWAWPCLAAVSTAAAAVLAVILGSRPAPVPEVRVVYVQVPAPAVADHPPPPAPGPDSSPAPGASDWPPVAAGMRLREHLFHWGLDGLPLPAAPPSDGSSDNPASLLRQE